MKNKIIIASIGVIALGGVIIYSSTKTESQIDDVADKVIKNVKIVDVESGYDSTIAYRGIVKGATEVHLAPKTQGRVTNVYKDIGDTVYKGQVLATIDGSELWAQTNVAQTGYQAAKDATKKTKDYFDKQVSQAKKGLDLAEEAYDAAKQGGDEDTIAQTKANYEMAKKSVSTAKKGRDLQVEMAKGQRDVAESQVIAAQTMASNTQLRAPFTGVLAQSNIEIGSLVSPQMPMFLIVGDAGQEVEISVAAKQLNNLSVGQEVTVRTDDDKKVKAQITAISPMVDFHTRKGLVKVTLPVDDGLVLGEYVRVFLPEANSTNEITIPRNAIVQEYHDAFVFIVEDNIAYKRAVTVGEDYGDYIVITNGIDADNVVVVEGQQYLSDGDFTEITV